MEEYKDIFSSPTRVPMHFQVKHPIDLTPSAPLHNGPVYHHSLMENMMKSSVISKIYFKMGKSDPSPPLAEARLYCCRRKTILGGSALIIEN
jgi:hypothetical protein